MEIVDKVGGEVVTFREPSELVKRVKNHLKLPQIQVGYPQIRHSEMIKSVAIQRRLWWHTTKS